MCNNSTTCGSAGLCTCNSCPAGTTGTAVCQGHCPDFTSPPPGVCLCLAQIPKLCNTDADCPSGQICGSTCSSGCSQGVCNIPCPNG
jgi:hypothetical protein